MTSVSFGRLYSERSVDLATVLVMGTQENKALLQGIFDALAGGDGRPFTDAMADDFRWRFAGEWSWVRDWGHTKQETARTCSRR